MRSAPCFPRRTCSSASRSSTSAPGAFRLAAQVEREADLQARLAHDNVVRIFGLAEECRPGFPPKFGLVLARLHEPLSALLARVASGAHGLPLDALPAAWRLNAVHELAAGLAHLHGHRIVHGDLKPGSMFLLFFGVCAVLRFLLLP